MLSALQWKFLMARIVPIRMQDMAAMNREKPEVRPSIEVDKRVRKL